MLRQLLILPIRAYRLLISPLLGQNCRFQPTCSRYAIEAIEEWGAVRGSWLAIKRIGRCHPFADFGPDPVPKRPGSDTSASPDPSAPANAPE